MVFVLWVPVLWSAWSSFCVVFCIAWVSFRWVLGGVSCVVLFVVPLGSVYRLLFWGFWFEMCVRVRGLSWCFVLFVFFGFASLFAS